MSASTKAIFLTATLLLSCHNPKAATKANFKVAIQQVLDKHPVCLPIALPAEPHGSFDLKPHTDPQLDALVTAGLATRQQVMMANSGSSMFGGPKQVSGPRYDFSPEGRKYAGHPENSALMTNTATLCYGTPEVVDIVRYSEPRSGLGQTMTYVTYSVALKSVASWVKQKDLQNWFPELSTIPTRANPQQRNNNLVLMSDGWRVADQIF